MTAMERRVCSVCVCYRHRFGAEVVIENDLPNVQSDQSNQIKPLPMKVNEISFIDRLVAAMLSALVVAIMAVSVPIALVVLSRGRGFELLGVFTTFRSWGTAIVITGWMVGFTLGSERVVVLMAHLWGTQRPKRIWITVSLWAALAGIASATYWLF